MRGELQAANIEAISATTVMDLYAHGYPHVGRQETMSFIAWVQYGAEIASYASASRHAYNDEIVNRS